MKRTRPRPRNVALVGSIVAVLACAGAGAALRAGALATLLAPVFAVPTRVVYVTRPPATATATRPPASTPTATATPTAEVLTGEPERTDPATATPQSQVPDTLPATLIYPAQDGNLWLYDVERREAVQLTAGGPVAAFRLNGPGDRLVYTDDQGAGYLLALSPSGDGQLYAGPLPLGRLYSDARGAPQLSWSGDGTHLYFADASGRSVIVPPSGAPQPLSADYGSLPRWSHDNRYLAFIEERVLWIAALDGDVLRVAEGIASAAWSPTQLLLAYTTVSTVENIAMADEPEGSETYVYDVARERSHLITRAGSLWAWLPDGEALVIHRLDEVGASAWGYTIFAADPQGERLLTVQAVHSDDPINLCPAADTRLVGPWEVDLAAERVHTTIELGYPIDWSRDGRYALVLEGNWGTLVRNLTFLDRHTGRHVLLVTGYGGLPRVERPGMWGHLSPSATWAFVKVTHGGASDSTAEQLLVRTDGSERINLDELLGASRWVLPFSPDDRWFVYEAQAGWALYDTRTRETHAIPGASTERPTWLFGGARWGQ